MVYSNLSSILLTFVKKGSFFKTPHTFYQLVYSGNLFRAAGKILLFQGCPDFQLDFFSVLKEFEENV